MSNKKHKHDEKPIDNQSADAPSFDNLGETAQQGQPTSDQAEEAEGKLETDLKAMSDALEKEKKEYLFLMAEFDNYRKRTVKEKADIIKQAAAKVLEGLLPIVDDFERGIEALKDTDPNDPARQGMALIYNKLVKYLESNGVKAIESTGLPFDPDTQEAIAMVPAQDESQKGQVIDTPTKGYTLNGRVLRHAKVVVAQ